LNCFILLFKLKVVEIIFIFLSLNDMSIIIIIIIFGFALIQFDAVFLVWSMLLYTLLKSVEVSWQSDYLVEI